MARTVNRTPITVPTTGTSLTKLGNKHYFNLAEFKGICSNKNYLTIDQSTFEDANNVYVDIDNQLSTRPVLRRVNILPEQEIIIKVFKVNNILFYHTKNNNIYYVRFKYNNDWKEHEVGDNILVVWFDKQFVIFSENTVTKSYDLYGYDNSTDEWLIASDLIYIPTTKLVVGTNISKPEAANVLTTSSFVKYVFTKGQLTDYRELIDKQVEVIIDGISYIVKFTPNTPNVFVKSLGQITVPHIVAASNFTYIAYDLTNKILLYSLDGNVFTQIGLPTNLGNALALTYAIDGGTLFIYDIANKRICYADIANASISTISALSWSYIPVPNPDNYATNLWASRNATNGQYNMSSASWTITANSNDVAATGYAFDGNACAFICTCTANIDLYSYRGRDLLASGTPSTTITQQMIMLITVVNGVAKSYCIDKHIAGTYIVRILPYKAGYVVALKYGTTIKIGIIPDSDSDMSYCINSLWQYASYYVVGKQFLFILDDKGTNSQDIQLYLQGNNIKYANAYRSNYTYYGVVFTDTFIVEKIANYNAEDYALAFTYPTYGTVNPDGQRRTYPYKTSNSVTTNITLSQIEINRILLPQLDSDSVLTDKYFYYGNVATELLPIPGSVYPLIVYNNIMTYQIFSNAGRQLYTNDDYTNIEVTYKTPGSEQLFLPSLFTTNSDNYMSNSNKLYTAQKRDGKLYFSVDDVLSFDGDITAITPFSTIATGIFLENSVYSYTYDSDNYVYRLSKTKLQLGNRKGSDVLSSYDGSTIFVTNIKGLTGLTYQDFVQSTELIYNYLTENIMNDYYNWSNYPILLLQYKDWLFMYSNKSQQLWLLDLRNASWWKWTLPYPPLQIFYDDTNLYVLANGIEYSFDFNTSELYDSVYNPVIWNIKTQKLHFNAPNNYKHVREVDIVTDMTANSMRYELIFTNYRNLNNLSQFDVVKKQISSLTTVINRVNFIKTNAFQVELKNDKTDNEQHKFVTPNIAIKYRVTERIR